MIVLRVLCINVGNTRKTNLFLGNIEFSNRFGDGMKDAQLKIVANHVGYSLRLYKIMRYWMFREWLRWRMKENMKTQNILHR